MTLTFLPFPISRTPIPAISHKLIPQVALLVVLDSGVAESEPKAVLELQRRLKV